ncbi:TrkH family potassium uptake protein [Ottowia testudinis]|uniref:TrkH family potassium uptake protein n=1 Tax=Ottowia testudinis TaxID=2816950 RepID=A0A975CGL1_9BURK|nr:potassium transporter TrkG [Ottowia testudinis]QTD45820.1 TrkH family potassium uptake protein [Ottowia testudinis]
MTRGPSRRQPLNPALVLVCAFLGVIALGTLLLLLPVSRAEPGGAPFMAAFFTAWSAVCINGLTIVDTGTYWSGFGQAVILMLIQTGGFGMMTSATLLILWAGGAMRLRSRLLLQAETRSASLGDVRSVAKLVFIVTVSVELTVATWLTLRFALGYGMPWGQAAWAGLFHAVSGFCNAGFGLWGDSLSQFVRDGVVLGPVMAAIIIGGLGFPVIHELWTYRRQRQHHYSMHTVLTLWGSAVLLVLGVVIMLLAEWGNAKTLGALDWPHKLLAALFTSVAARSVGFNAIDTAAMTDDAMVLHYFLMYVGAGSAGTGGGVKVTTFFILMVAVWSEVRGYPDTQFRGRRITPSVLRQALTILVLSSGVIVLGLMAVMPMSDQPYEKVLFEVVSAAGNVGLSAGVVGTLPPAGQFVLLLLMFSGRVGVVTLAVALAARAHKPRVRYPEEKPLVG